MSAGHGAADTARAAPASAGIAGRALEFVRTVQDLKGWRRYGAAAVLGGVGALAQAPFSILPALIVSFCGLMFLLDGAAAATVRPGRAGFLIGWAYGFGYFMGGMYWLGFAFLVQADQFAWMIPIAIPAFMGFLGLFFAVPAVITVKIPSTPLTRVIVLAVTVSLFELLRGHILTGLPWNLAGQAMATTPVLAQTAAWWGPYGLSLVVLVLSVMPAAAVRPDGNPAGWRPLAAAAGGGAALLVAGMGRLALAPEAPAGGDVPHLVVVQPNVPQRDKLDPEKRNDHFSRTVALTRAAVQDGQRTVILWPENTYPYLASDPTAPRFFAEAFPGDSMLLTGTFRSYRDAETGRTAFGNSAALFGPTGASPPGEPEKPLEAVYDKHHLVPFGEYLPMKGFLKAVGLSQLAPVEDGFTPGPGPQVIGAAGLRFAPLICYEDVFPGALYPRGERPDFLAVVTNDAWFGDNAGPRQHLAISRLRTIESGLPMARSANTGISAIIDAHGRLVASLPLYQSGTLSHPIPAKLSPTLYDRLRNLPYFSLILCLGGLCTRAALARYS